MAIAASMRATMMVAIQTNACSRCIQALIGMAYLPAASSAGSVLIPLDLLDQIDNSTPYLIVTDPHERFR
jgi:hypothetical protein